MNQTIREVLFYVNGARYILGLDPLTDLPKGKIENENSCPLAKALNSECVDLDQIIFDTEFEAKDIAEIWKVTSNVDDFPLFFKVRTPKLLREFIQDFDNKRYPEYIEEEV